MMTRSITLDRLRKRVKAVEISMSGEQNPSFEQLSSQEAMQTFEKAFENEWVNRLLGGLPDSQRRCLEMTVLEGYTQAEVANRLNRPLGTVKSEIRRGLARLRTLWNKEDPHAS
jgi:RNA polymerase sigma-70 factor (ECF subfamily)